MLPLMITESDPEVIPPNPGGECFASGTLTMTAAGPYRGFRLRGCKPAERFYRPLRTSDCPSPRELPKRVKNLIPVEGTSDQFVFSRPEGAALGRSRIVNALRGAVRAE